MAYRVSCQHAHHDHSESEDLGTMGSADVLRRFDAFDWSKSAPTLSVEEPSNSSMMFVSQCRPAKLELDTQDEELRALYR